MARLVPCWLSLLGWNIAYSTASTLMVQQGEGLDGRVGLLTVPPATMFVCATVTLLAAIPLYERAILPRLRAAGRAPSQLQRTGAALAVITLAMLVAGSVEGARLRSLPPGYTRRHEKESLGWE